MDDSHDDAPAGPAARRVLAERNNGGIQVTLLWAEDTNAVSVLVRDDGTDDQFELSVEPADALDTFEHPYAYAAWRGVDYRLANRKDAA
jgi:hypothetical protein